MFAITLPHKPKIKTIANNQSIFEIEACFPGYGLTLGNALRRVLLSSLPGSAITAFKIKNVPHEFTVIDSVEEDMIQIMLNLKKVRFKSHADEPFIGKISVKGNRKVLAKDIKLPSEIEVINKDSVIASLSSLKANFNAELLIERGLGYLTAQENKSRRQISADMINIDSIFSPIQKINFKIEDMRVGERTDYNRLIFDIATDGSISPEEAFRYGVKILLSQFDVFIREESELEKKAYSEQSEYSNARETQDKSKLFNQELLSSSIDSLKMSSRVTNALMENKIATVGDLIKQKEQNLMKLNGIGDKAIKEIKRRLGRVGLALD